MSGLIPQGFIDNLLARADIAEIIGQRIQLKKTGKNFSALCPFHNEKSPSFSVNPDRQFYYCFGCQAGGNVLSFLMDYENFGFVEAVETLASNYGLRLPEREKPNNYSQQQAAQVKQVNEQRLACMQAATHFYSSQLNQPAGKAGLDYLASRQLSPETQAFFQLGVAPNAWQALEEYLTQQGFGQAMLVELGLSVERESNSSQQTERRTYDRFRHRVIFPIRNLKGQVVGFGGRVLDDSKPKYLNSPETPLFHKSEELYGLYEARTSPGRLEKLLVVEGYMDVIALAQQGINYAVATLGTSVSEQHLRTSFRLVNQLVFCFDGDAAGQQAAIRALHTLLPLMQDGRQARFLFLPAGEDPDSLVKKEGAGRFEQRIGLAQPFAEFLLSHLRQNLNLGLLDDQAKLAQLAQPMIKALPPSLLKQRLITYLEDLTQIKFAAGAPAAQPTRSFPAAQQNQGYQPSNYQQQASQNYAHHLATASYTAIRNKQITNQLSNPKIEEKILSLLLAFPRLAEQLDKNFQFTDANYQQVLVQLLEFVASSSHLSSQVVLSYWSGTDLGNYLINLVGGVMHFDYAGAEVELKALIAHLDELKRRAGLDSEYTQLLNSLPTQEQDSTSHLQQLWQLVKQQHNR